MRRSTRTTSATRCNILFTCVGRRVALLNSFRAALAELGVEGALIATDITDTSPAYHAADVGVLVPSAGRVEYVPTLLETVRKHEVSLVVPLTDLDLRILSRQRDQFSAAGCTVMIGSEDSVTLCRDKARTNVLLGEAGLASIGTHTLSEFLREPFYPCFVKPVRGSAGVGTAVIHNDGELRTHVATYGGVLLVQEYIPGREYTIDVYRSREGEVRSVVPRQRLQVRSGEVEKGITVRSEELSAAAIELAGRLGDLWGVFCCQCRWSTGQPPQFFEINPRFGGGAPLSIAAGANLPLYLLQEVLGLPITAELGTFQENLLMLRYDAAIFLEVENPADLPGYDSPTFR